MQDDLNLFSLISPNGDVISRFGRFPGELNENMDSKSLHFLTQCLVEEVLQILQEGLEGS